MWCKFHVDRTTGKRVLNPSVKIINCLAVPLFWTKASRWGKNKAYPRSGLSMIAKLHPIKLAVQLRHVILMTLIGK